MWVKDNFDTILFESLLRHGRGSMCIKAASVSTRMIHMEHYSGMVIMILLSTSSSLTLLPLRPISSMISRGS